MAGLSSLVKMVRGVLYRSTDGERANRLTVAEALSHPAVWNAVSRITGAFMVMDFELLREVDNRTEVQKNNDLHVLMSSVPNEYQTAQQWRRLMLFHALMHGNGRSYIVRENGSPVELIPLDPERTITQMFREGGTVSKWHLTLMERDDRLSLHEDIGQNTQKVVAIPDSDMWHLPGLSYDGISGIPLLETASRTIGIGVGYEKNIQKQNKKGYGGGLMLEAPIGMFRKEEDAQNFLNAVKKQMSGEKGEAISLLREGMKANMMSMSNSDAQMVENRRFNREDVALLMSLPGILGDNSNASYSSEMQKWIAYKTDCLAPHMVSFESESNIKLLNVSLRRRGFSFKFDERTFMRMDPNALMTFCVQGRTAGILNSNECRKLFQYNGYEGGDSFENPNTSSSGGAANQPNDPAATAGQKAVTAMLGNLVSVESKRCVEHADEANFLSWMDGFYATWQQKLADCITQLGGDREIASEYCEESKRQLLEASECKPEELAASIAKCVKEWPNRVRQLAEEITLCLK